ncbi:class I SAM-dependent methyltransferase [Pyrinomonas methylaliphatogenes]|jgi:ubiquinone/menaquinone biosynthesis C-methylase UbiE|uniref:Methylase involved in ubiquinone/menaquinone biosynthesis n=1 Tax=Pyrinomonas methylaliphatogenes TaxID=454194 RepID=A0A0B6WY85_9BACT|nr:class I SAM-dependent methyltransferase [Pyrinomonas methylaliphatogenes]CDM65090.1 methylase involved in ubiquinone/menaquinone biosynthesis [Pyrinomonas methylaliphatogenes]
MSQPRLDVNDQVKGSAWWGIHAARYFFAVPHVRGKRVLDVACGSGYGLAVLRRSAREVVGVEVELDVARRARVEVSKDTFVSIIVADGCKMPFVNGCFDVITSFETIEHIHHRARFLEEIRRVLKTDGMFIISTPNAHYTQPVNGKPRNPYHVYEYTPEELALELRNYFKYVDLFGQILSPRFKVSPFWDDQRRLPHTIEVQSMILLWRVLNKLPVILRDKLSQIFWGHPLIPTERDYEFSPSAVETAPVTVAICRQRS